MSQKDRLLDLFNLYGGKLTLGQLLSDPSGVGYKCTSRFSELRKQGYHIVFTPGKTPSENLYELKYFDRKGQGNLL